jgi:hypothetical protein
VTNDGLFVEGVGVLVVEDCACGDKRVSNSLTSGTADSQFNAGRIDAFLLNQVLASIQRAFSGGFGFLLGSRVADHNQPGVGLLREG